MEAAADIFSRLPDGPPLWLESVEGLQNARGRVTEPNRVAPQDGSTYFERDENMEPEQTLGFNGG